MLNDIFSVASIVDRSVIGQPAGAYGATTCRGGAPLQPAFAEAAAEDLVIESARFGLILCQTKDKVLAEYALRGIQQPIGVSNYELTRSLPEDLQSSLPSISELEAKLGAEMTQQSADTGQPSRRSRQVIHNLSG